MLESMLEAGVHFGHQVGRWNPKMAPYIYEEKNGIHVLDLVQTVRDLEKAREAQKMFYLLGQSHKLHH
jgi:small subunit ribosomal protein S2